MFNDVCRYCGQDTDGTNLCPAHAAEVEARNAASTENWRKLHDDHVAKLEGAIAAARSDTTTNARGRRAKAREIRRELDRYQSWGRP